ncbi:hypothetical protein [Chelativorans sp. AA-79]|uniref:hypothetical protein n=1 Tax=Chelativorans sp. AA-79 TaxID=3028735 RepID=UPI0023F7CEB2|nr:hypothetical protein [Chelativorans sp. AA-79]WEX07740.1 hypothetical protein PVE73_16735 [Chelativorans sp. AA-79]
MRYGSAAAQRTAMRALFEGAPATLDLLARAGGRTEAFLVRVAREEGWKEPAFDVDPEALEKRLVTLSDRLVGDLEAASAEGRAAGSYDKHRIDALAAMLKMVEKLGEMTRLPERAAERQNRSDADLAAALSLIDARIVELACALAASMGGGEADGGGGAADSF